MQNNLTWPDIAKLLNISQIQFDSHEESVSMMNFFKGFIKAHGEQWLHDNRFEVIRKWEFQKQAGLEAGRKAGSKKKKKA